MIQGDNFLFLFKNAPLKGLPLSEKAVTNKSGMVKIKSGNAAVSAFMGVISRRNS